MTKNDLKYEAVTFSMKIKPCVWMDPSGALWYKHGQDCMNCLKCLRINYKLVLKDMNYKNGEYKCYKYNDEIIISVNSPAGHCKPLALVV